MEAPKNRLVRITKDAAFLPDRINTGIIRGSGNACLVIDTGLDKSSANRISAVMEAEGLRPAALLVTHTHADHCGGNAALHRMYGMPAYCPPMETAILAYPVMEPMYLYGASPPDALMNKFFLAPATPDARPLPPGRQEINGVPVTAVKLAGHSPEHTGYLTDDGVLFCGDALFPAYVWEKYRLPHFYDISAALVSLDVLEEMAPSLKACVAAHYGLIDIIETIKANREGLLSLVQWVETALAAAPMSREGIIAKAFNEFGLNENEAQYYLVGSTLAALLTHLCSMGKAEARMAAGRLKYQLK